MPSDQLRLGIQKIEHEARQQKTERADEQARQQADQQRSMVEFKRLSLFLRAQMLRRDDVDAAAHADQKTGEQRHENRRRADRAQRPRAREAADDRHVRHVEQHLKHLREHQRHAEHENLLPKGACGHVHAFAGGEKRLPVHRLNPRLSKVTPLYAVCFQMSCFSG